MRTRHIRRDRRDRRRGDELPPENGADGFGLERGITRAHEAGRRFPCEAKPSDYIGFRSHAPQRRVLRRDARARVALRSTSGQRADDHELGRAADGPSRRRASSPSTNILMCGRIAPCSSTIRKRSPGNLASRSRSASSRVACAGSSRFRRPPCTSAGGRGCGRSASGSAMAIVDFAAPRLMRTRWHRHAADGAPGISSFALRRDCPRSRRSSSRSKRPLSALGPPSLPGA